eukprot:Opistho-2@44996
MASAASIVRELSEDLPGRQDQIEFLVRAFGRRTDRTVPALFIYGHTATGKTLVVQSLLRRLGLPHVYANCLEHYTPRLFYEGVLSDVRKVAGVTDDDHAGKPCAHPADFVRELARTLLTEPAESGSAREKGASVTSNRTKKGKETASDVRADALIEAVAGGRRMHGETVYIVVDNAERLRGDKGSATMLPMLLRLPELLVTCAGSIVHKASDKAPQAGNNNNNNNSSSNNNNNSNSADGGGGNAVARRGTKRGRTGDDDDSPDVTVTATDVTAT